MIRIQQNPNDSTSLYNHILLVCGYMKINEFEWLFYLLVFIQFNHKRSLCDLFAGSRLLWKFLCKRRNI